MTSQEFARVIPLHNIWPLGFAFQALWTPLIVRQTYVDHGMIDIHLVFYSSFGLCSLLVAVIFLHKRFAGSKIPYTALCILSALGEGFASFVLTAEFLGGSELMAFWGSAVGGVGLVASMLAWGSFFKRLPMKQCMAYILIAYMISFFLQSWCYLLFPTGATFVMALLALCGPFCLALSNTTIPEINPLPSEGRTNPVASTHSLSAGKATAKRRPFLKLLIAFAVYSFVLTLRNPLVFPSNSLTIVVLYGIALIVTMAIYWAMIVARSSLTFESMMQLLLIAFTLGFFLQPFVPDIISDIPPTLLVVATALIYMLVWMVVIETIHLSNMHPFAIVGIWGACYGCPRLLYYVIGIFVPVAYGSAETTMMIALVALFSLFIVFFLVSRQPHGSRQLLGTTTDYDIAADDEPLPLQEWQEIAQEHGLTEREREVFYLACEGHSRRYIAECLFISENTVKAHLKRIYAKTGVHSKYDLEKILNTE